MSIGEILLGLLVGGGVGGGASYFLQKSRTSEIARRCDQKYLQTRQALDEAEAELKEQKTQIFALSQSEARAKTELQNEQANYQNHLEQIESSYQIQLEENQNQASMAVSSELERVKAQLLNYQSQIEAYQTQILELQQAVTPTVDLEQAILPRIQEIEQHHQAYIEQLQQTYSTQLQEIESAHQAELFRQQQTYFTQFQEIEQAYQNQIVELEKTHQTQILELEQAYQSQMLELQQVESDLEQLRISERPDEDEIVQPSQFTEPWDEDFSKATLLEMSFPEAEEIAEISSLEELANLTSQTSDEPEKPAINGREQAEFFASQTLIGDIDFLESMPSEPEKPAINGREQAEFFASQTLIGDIDFLESMPSETEASNFEVSENAFIQEELFQDSELSTANLAINELPQSDEMDFLESLEIEAQDSNSRFELEDLTSVKQDFFASERSAAEDDFSEFVLTSEEMKADLNEQFILESNNPFELADQSIDLDLFDSFETPKYGELDLDEENLNKMHTNGANDVLKGEFDVYPSDPDLDFFNMLEKEHSETSESLDIDDKELNIEDLFSEDLFHSEWESSPKN